MASLAGATRICHRRNGTGGFGRRWGACLIARQFGVIVERRPIDTCDQSAETGVKGSTIGSRSDEHEDLPIAGGQDRVANR